MAWLLASVVTAGMVRYLFGEGLAEVVVRTMERVEMMIFARCIFR